MAAFADKLLLFNVDGTLTPARQVRFRYHSGLIILTPYLEASQKMMIYTFRALRKKLVIGFVEGSDMVNSCQEGGWCSAPFRFSL